MDSANAPTLEAKKIGTTGLVVNGLAYLCPACILMYYGVMNVQSGGSFPLALLIAGLVMLPTAMSYVKMSQKYPHGAMLRLIRMVDDPNPIKPVTVGEVDFIDDAGNYG